VRCVHVLWLTGRSTADLCSTTQRSLIEGILNLEHRVSFVNGDDTVPLNHIGFTHVPLSSKAPRGFQARALGKTMAVWLTGQTIDRDSTVALVEWRVAQHVVPVLLDKGIPWALMDRSPPADPGLLGRLQWRSWSQAWKLAKRAGVPGLVVSAAHQAFVAQKTGHEHTTVIQAGVNLNRFRPAEKRPTFTMVYHGRLDRHRGLLACVMLAQKARNEGLEVDAMFVGEGDLLPALQRLADGNAFIHVRTTMEQEMLASLLGTCHLGLLPMPKRTAWMLASPLKRSEFLASGLPVFGIDHQGHRLAGVDSAWFTLAAQEDFHADGLEVLRRHMDANGQHSAAARAYAETNLDWSISVDALMRVLSDLNQSES